MTTACCPSESLASAGGGGGGQNSFYGVAAGLPAQRYPIWLVHDGLHHYLETVVPADGVQIQHMRLRELVYADDICLMASSPEHLQALIAA